MNNLLPAGVRYEARVPATLDLAERARIAINGLTGVLDPSGIHEMYFLVGLGWNPPFMYKDTTGWPTNNPKFGESLPMMRVMSGSEQNLGLESAMMTAMLNAIGEDGLFYAIAGPERPWHEGVHHVYATTGEDFANSYGNARMLLALMAWYARDPDPALWQRMQKMAAGLAEMAVCKHDYAYYPDGQIGEAFSRPRSGWRDTTEPAVEPMGAEGSMFMYQGGQIRALARWYEMSGDAHALDIASRLVRFVLKPKFWGVDGELPFLCGAEHGHFTGHFHGHTSLLRGLLEYARVVRDARVLDFVRESYEFCRHYGLPQVGWFANEPRGVNEGCTVADMAAIAARLSDIGAGDYWEDVEQIVRNHLAEQQLVDLARLRLASAQGPVRPVDRAPTDGEFHPNPEMFPGQLESEDVIERAQGIFAGHAKPDGVASVWSMQCCTANGTQALYYAWDSVIRYERGQAQINLLLNRASPWLDVNSYLPYQGKIEVRNKRATRLAVHIPRWVARSEVQLAVNDEPRKPDRVGNYVLCQGLTPGDTVVIQFPMRERAVTYTLDGQVYQLHFRGNDLLEISPHASDRGYPFYLDRPVSVEEAPLRTVERYVTETILPW